MRTSGGVRFAIEVAFIVTVAVVAAAYVLAARTGGDMSCEAPSPTTRRSFSPSQPPLSKRLDFVPSRRYSATTRPKSERT